MKASPLSRWCAISMAMLLALGLSTAPLLAAPLFLHPGGTHPPGFAVHLPAFAPAPLVPAGAAVGPIPYGDLLPNPFEPHHLEIELNNPTAVPASFNVAITYPGGAFPLTGISLPPGGERLCCG